jgi:hypothetical protein
MLVDMPRRTKKSSSNALPLLEKSLSVGAAGDAAGRHADHLAEWRVTSMEVATAYDVWCAASGRDRRRCYLLFVDAFIREEMAARWVQRSASALDTGHAVTPHA